MKKILVARLSSLGDIILTQPVLEAVHAAGDEVTLMVQDAYKALGSILPGVDHILLPNQKPKYTFDVVLDLHRTGRSAKVLRHIRRKSLVHYPKHALARRLLVRPQGRRCWWHRWPLLDERSSVVDWYGEAARQVGYALVSREPRLSFDGIDREAYLDQLQADGLDLNRDVAVLAPGAKWATKRWPETRFITLADRLTERGVQVVLIGDHDEFPIGQRIKAQTSKPVLSLIGKTSLTKLAVLLSQAMVLISNDSGPLHLGLASGTKAVALFGPTVGAFGFMPRSARCRVLSVELPCRPCAVHGSKQCPLGHHACMTGITVEQVLEAMEQLEQGSVTKNN